MEQVTKSFLEYGLLGAALVVLAYVVWHQRKEISEINKDRIQDKESELQRKDSDAEKYISIIEKSLNALTRVEKSLFESSSSIPLKTAEMVKRENEPLITELKRIIERFRNGKTE